MLSIEKLVVRYGGIVALREVSIDVKEGETVLLVGANGAGKSSLINAVVGLVPAISGQIRFAGKDLVGVSCPGRARLGIGYSPEGRRIFRSLSVRENVLAGTLGISKMQAQANLEWMERTFPLLAERADQPANQLSGGQQQVVALARAASTLPKLLLLDEPFLGLAPVWIERISESIRELQRRGTTILMTEQMARPALKLVDRAYVMRGGEVRRSGTVDEIRDVALAEEYL
ncbi:MULTISPECIES: ABC transporter ATP-binding protein [Burkholderia]|uniref:ABC transporter n=2 Tax=Bacteria TaxID=2 RepID=A0AAE8T6H7_BURCE|nr:MULTISPECIES: ABC transporter ATP-binding protein [Burkholderia]KVF56526.1 ABC transporter ATP-binding protein [Burkholderia cepacia]MBR8393112.1 ABC transporter ATP-binding protein [Burkholderia cenocepacia]MBR8470776.1 ABC transporter ATP-binding protein [Burkholderia cenocepacia]MBR8489676.1 ABC transporter ATP-binding protein [Burkholderia cenocepacia]MBY4798971.1 ABC transporter ATP-binding protein [Burkholderia cepacia]